VTDERTGSEIADLVNEVHPVPVVILADTDELEQILKALNYGAKAYIPSSIRFEICVEAVNLVLAGGTFVPASSVFALHKAIGTGVDMTRAMASVFTERQEEVVQALRRGKANKIIAHELNLRESTVKVHIRNIMKKLKATNRTEVVYKLNEMFPGTLVSSRSS
jgi:DNA-binding NarL/FixJ family response regulator